MQVIVVGFGKIGRIKASFWHAAGADVYVHDTNDMLRADIVAAGYKVYDPSLHLGDDVILDISTPAATHFAACKWTLESLDAVPRVVLVEKPLASSLAELTAFRSYVDSFHRYDLRNRLFVNESYHTSTALAYVRRLVRQRRLKLNSIEIELSKNRLADTAAGRFFDHNLGSLGIEMPHMIAIMREFGLDAARLRTARPTIFVDKDRDDNQGFELQETLQGVSVTLISYLGNFRVGNEGIRANSGVVRTVHVKTDRGVINVEFDPASDVPRYHARVTMRLDGEDEVKILADDHLKNHLASIMLDGDAYRRPELGFEDAVSISKLLDSLRVRCRLETVDTSKLFESDITEAVQAQLAAPKGALLWQ